MALVVLRKDIIALNAQQRAKARAEAAALQTDKTGDRTKRRQAKKLTRALDKSASIDELVRVELKRAMRTLDKWPEADRGEKRHATRTLKRLHEHMTDKQRAALGRLATRLAANPRHARTAKALARIAEKPSPRRKRGPRQR